MRKIIGIGESILDIIFRNGQPERATPGGSVFNCMVSLSRCNIPAIFISELGNDKVGKLIKKFMKKNGLNTDHIYTFDDGASPVSLAFLDTNGDAEYQFFTDYPEKRLQSAFPEINEDDLLIIGSYFAVNPVLRQKLIEFLNQASKNKSIIYYDINFRKAHTAERNDLMPAFLENFQYADIVRCSDEDLENLGNPDVGWFCDNFIITRGENEISLHTPMFKKNYCVDKIKSISTIGAGDNFNAGILYGIVKENISRTDLQHLSEKLWDKLIDYGKRFAQAVCLSNENYI
ncbi:MAG: PfkB family carbohydrate kinase [Dysgonamonadaceae bacterium]|jgi:fructokinase|nr:PfkB family carbohydrate kinase [Dysgonamonadaceae bacterium]